MSLPLFVPTDRGDYVDVRKAEALFIRPLASNWQVKALINDRLTVLRENCASEYDAKEYLRDVVWRANGGAKFS